MRFFVILVSAILLSGCGNQEGSFSRGQDEKGIDTKFSEYVNPNIGSVHSRWFFYTPGAVPFGMAKLGPSTNGSYGNEQGWEAVGYDDRHQSIEGFACFHEFQIGGVMLQPMVGALQTKTGTLESTDEGYRSTFDKTDEHATSGYYSVLLKDYNVKVELTATQRVGFQRYTFPETPDARIIFDIGNQLGESGSVKDAYVEVVDETTVAGYVVTEPEYVKKYQEGADVKMYFYARIDKPANSVNTFFRGSDIRASHVIRGPGACAVLNYDFDQETQVTVKLGLSYTSIGNAKLNLETEAANSGFDDVREKALATWNESLSRVAVEGGTNESRVKFYTGLWHALLGRGLANDVNGAYPMNSGEIGYIEKNKNGELLHNHYNTDAIWGAFWNLTQLWTLAYPEYYSDWIQSQLLVYKETGWLGDGIAASKYVSGVGTNFVSLAISAAYNCGIRDFDVPLAYEAAYKNEVSWENRIEGAGKMDVKQFVKRGYVPYSDQLHFQTTPEGSGFGASHTLEYSFSSFGVSQFARHLGKTDDREQLLGLSKGWKQLFDYDAEVIHPKNMDGEFIENFDPLAPWIGFQEGNSMQYTFYVPHDIRELVGIMGAEKFNNRLDSIFAKSQQQVFGGGTTVDAFSGLTALYNHGNQPSLHMSWLFNFSGKPHLSQKWVRNICQEFYGVEGLHGYGFGQDEDQGQLGAWYVMSSIGLFDVKGLTDSNAAFQVGSPLFDKVTIQLNQDYYDGEKFVIKVADNSEDNKYIQSVQFNGQTHEGVFLPFEDVVKGGELLLEMGEEPKTNASGSLPSQ
jgi:predicted alpha-1,2-mannosidase